MRRRGRQPVEGLACSPQNLVIWGMVTGVVGQVDVSDLITWLDHHHAAELRRVADRSALNDPVAAARGRTFRHHPGSEQLREGRDLRAGRLIALTALVYVQRDVELVAVAEVRGVLGGALADHR